MNLHAEGDESVVDDGAVSKIDFITLSCLLDFMSKGLGITVAGLEIGFGWLGVGESGHDVSFQTGNSA